MSERSAHGVRRTARGLVMAMAIFIAAGTRLNHAQAADWRHWQYAAPIDAPATAAGALVSTVITPDVASHARADWADLRVVDADDREVPFLLRERRGARRHETRPGRLLDRAWVPGQYSQAVVDLGDAGGVHNRVRLTLAGGDDFAAWIEIAASGNGREWATVRDRAPIYSLMQTGFGQWLDATYPDSTARFLRVRVLDGGRRYDIAGIDVAREIDDPADLSPAPVTLLSVSGTAGRADRSVYQSSPPVAGLNVGELAIETSTPLFDRPVLVEASEDGTGWSRVAEGEIYRTQARGGTQESLRIRIDAGSAPHWRVTIYNRNDQPLADLKISALETPRRVVFRAEPGRRYWLLSGNSRAPQPQYDLARTMDPTAIDIAVPATTGRSVPRADYADPRPWTEQHPVVLWTAAAFAVIVLGGLAIRTLRT